MLAGPSRPRRGFANDQLWFDGYLRRVFLLAFHPVKQALGRNFSHAFQRLAHGGQTGSVKSRPGNVIEAHDRDVLGNTQSLLLQGTDGADGGDVVVSKQGREGFSARQQLFRDRLLPNGPSSPN